MKLFRVPVTDSTYRGYEKKRRLDRLNQHDGSEAMWAKTKARLELIPEILFKSELEIIGSLSEVYQHVLLSIV
jgi:hypothetical protein